MKRGIIKLVMSTVPAVWMWSWVDFDMSYLIGTIGLVIVFYMLFLITSIFYRLGLDDTDLSAPGADPP